MTVLVPEVLEQRSVDEWVYRIRSNMRRGAEAIIAVGQDLVDAEATLGRGEFAQLRSVVDLSDSSIRKFRAIAKNPALRSHVNALPAAWGTLYELSQLTEADLEDAVERGAVSPTMERGAASALVRKYKLLGSKPEQQGSTGGDVPPASAPVDGRAGEVDPPVVPPTSGPDPAVSTLPGGGAADAPGSAAPRERQCSFPGCSATADDGRFTCGEHTAGAEPADDLTDEVPADEVADGRLGAADVAAAERLNVQELEVDVTTGRYSGKMKVKGHRLLVPFSCEIDVDTHMYLGCCPSSELTEGQIELGLSAGEGYGATWDEALETLRMSLSDILTEPMVSPLDDRSVRAERVGELTGLMAKAASEEHPQIADWHIDSKSDPKIVGQMVVDGSGPYAFDAYEADDSLWVAETFNEHPAGCYGEGPSLHAALGCLHDDIATAINENVGDAGDREVLDGLEDPGSHGPSPIIDDVDPVDVDDPGSVIPPADPVDSDYDRPGGGPGSSYRPSDAQDRYRSGVATVEAMRTLDAELDRWDLRGVEMFLAKHEDQAGDVNELARRLTARMSDLAALTAPYARADR